MDEMSIDDNRWHTGHELQQENYSFILEKLLETSWLGVIFKPKSAKTLRKRLGTSITELLDIAEKKGPKNILIILGYSGWGSGQLEGEMESDHWLLSNVDLDIVFEEESKKKWERAYKKSFIKI